MASLLSRDLTVRKKTINKFMKRNEFQRRINYPYTLMILLPSTLTRVLFPTISVGYTKSSRNFSCTEVRVRDRGRACLARDLRPGLRIIFRCAIKTMWRSENFFSSSRVSLLLYEKLLKLIY